MNDYHTDKNRLLSKPVLLASVAQSDVYPHPIGDQEVLSSIPAGSGNVLFVKIDQEIFFMVILFH